MRTNRFHFIAGYIVLGWSTLAFAQLKPADVECKKTETQAECHDRLKCKADEELADCQRRLLSASSNGGGDTSGGNNGADRGERSGGDRGGGDRGGGARGERDRGGGDRDRGDRGGGDRGDDRDERGSSRSRGGNRGRAGSRHPFEANKTFGMGLELGEPTGLNGKYFISDSGAFDFGLGYIYDHYYYGDGFHIYADYLAHLTSLASTPDFELPFYIGGGLRYWNFRYCFVPGPGPGVVCDYGGSALGVRVPFGLAFDFNNVPLDIFVELVPTLDFLTGDYYNRYRDRAHFGIDGSVGARFWFK